MFEKELESRIQSAFNVSDIGKDLHFTSRRSAINWIKVVSADINKIIIEKDYGCLKENVLNIIHYDLDSVATSKVLDPGFVKLFRLAQLAIEYLLYAQNHFQKRSKQLSEEKNIVKKELEKRVAGGRENGDLNAHQNSLNAPELRKESHLVLIGSDTNNTFRCMLCGKIFLNGCYLYAHHQRRHSQNVNSLLTEIPTAASSSPSKLPEKSNKILDGETEKIWKELEWLREKVYESLSTEKPMHQNTSLPEVAIKSNQNINSQWTRKNHQSPEKRDEAVPVRVKLNTEIMQPYFDNNLMDNGDDAEEKLDECQIDEVASKEKKEEEMCLEQRVNRSAEIMESNCVDNVKGNEDLVEKNLIEHCIEEVLPKEDTEEEICFAHEPKDSYQTKAEPAFRNRVGDFDSNTLGECASSSPPVEELKKKPSFQETAVKEDNGRLEAQERVWRGRLKALADKSSQEIESLRRMISSLQEKESEVEEEYREKIQKLTLQLKEQEYKPTDDKAISTIKEEESVQEIPSIPSIAEDVESPPSSRDATVTSLSPAKQPESRESPLDSSVSNESEVRSRASDLEYDSSDASTSPNMTRRILPSDHTSEDEESDPEMAIEVFEKKLRQLNINPTAKSMPEKVLKEKMEMLNAERRILKRNIENYHHIKSNLEEKADARVSQKMLRLKLDKPKLAEELSISGSGHRSPKDASSWHKMKEFPSSTSSKESLVATMSKPARSSHSHSSSGRTLVSQSSIKSMGQQSEEDLPPQSRISVLTERLRSSKGMGTVTADFHPKFLERNVLPGISSFQSSSGMGDGISSVGGSILRGVHHARGEGEKVAAVPSYGGYGSKSVSFAHDVIGGKVYRAV